MSAATFDRYLLPLLLLLLAGIGGFAADRAARARRRPEGDRGDFWAAITWRTCLLLAPLVLLSGWLETVAPPYWKTGRHLHLDRVGAFGWSIPASYRVALLLPFLAWGALLLLGVAAKPRGREAGRWLAGAIGFGTRRSWVLLGALPLAAIDWWTLPRLGGGLQAYPAAAWATQAVIVLSLVGVALSAGREPTSAATPS
ncbi:MAG TPA: hypothetical protein VFS60_13340, partial [Thermoanaerobaculia bacterium]|nr:hypothetical protein [Thermoanaerobaculia bacterium]